MQTIKIKALLLKPFIKREAHYILAFKISGKSSQTKLKWRSCCQQ
jgi:hypothetical protein